MILRVALLAFAFVLATAAQSAAATPRLRAEAVVDAPVVTLGDVLDVSGPAAEAVLARAPAPGRRMVISVSHIFRVARASGLEWKPMRGLDRVVVRRAGQRIPRSVIETRIAEALKDLAPDENLRVSLQGRATEIVLPTGAPATIDIENISLDRARGRLTATVIAAADTAMARRVNIIGRVYAVVEVPVLRRTIRRGEVIQASDVKWTEMRATRVRQPAIADPADIVGLAARRMLRAGQPLRPGDLRTPVVVAKGANVTMTYRTKFMVLTVAGRALEDGGVGETIRVLNTQSNTVIDAVVERSGVVVVASRRRIALN